MKALWPERYPEKELQRRRQEMGSLAYDKEYLVTPRSDTSSLFPFELFENNFAPEETMRSSCEPGPEGLIVATGWDFAIGLSGDTDYNVGYTAAVDREGFRHILDITRVRHLKDYQAILNLVKKKAEAYHPGLIILETVNFQVIFKQALEIERIPSRIEGHKTGREKADLEEGVPGLRILLEQGKYRIPRGDPISRNKTDTWISECSAFGWQDDKLGGVGEHDDTVMAWWFCELALSRLMEKRRRSGAVIALGASRGPF
jgi:hypothetical protein